MAAATWFSPMPYAPIGATEAMDGSSDYDQLFDAPDGWRMAAAATDVVKLYSGWVEWHATTAQLQAIVSATKARGQLLALEIGPLVGTDDCGLDVEGFNATLNPIDRIHEAGGTVSLVAFDEPYAFGHLYDGPRACRWPIERVAQATARFVSLLRLAEPGIRVGDIEPLWAELSPAELGSWLDAYRAAAGEPFDFVHLDVDWAMAEWGAWVEGAAHEIQSRGVTLGVIYNGGSETSDRAWTDAARGHIQGVEERLGGRPAQTVFQSWMQYPRHVLPETDLTSFTGLLRQYATGARTRLTVTPGGGGGITGQATSLAGSPLARATVEVSAIPLDGGFTELSAAGTVPAGATTALVGIRVNTEGGGPGSVHFGVYSVSYREAAGSRNLVPDPGFAQGTAAWGIDGLASVQFTRSDRGAGRMVRITATASQALVMNGREFRVKEGRPFELVATVDAPALGASPPLLVLVFLRGTELSRTSIPIRPLERAVATVTTDVDGSFGLARPELQGRLELLIRYPGDLDHWPASEELLLAPTGA